MKMVTTEQVRAAAEWNRNWVIHNDEFDAWLDGVKREAAEQALDDAASLVERLYAGSDGDAWDRGYITGCDQAAQVIRNRAAVLRLEGK